MLEKKFEQNKEKYMKKLLEKGKTFVKQWVPKNSPEDYFKYCPEKFLQNSTRNIAGDIN